MEDKQIYTSARSEEIKRQLIALTSKFKKTLSDYNKKRKTKSETETISQKPEVKVQIAAKSSREKLQNIRIEPGVEKNSKSGGDLKKLKTQRGETFNHTAQEKIFSISVYTLFAIIILIIGLGIWLSYFK